MSKLARKPSATHSRELESNRVLDFLASEEYFPHEETQVKTTQPASLQPAVERSVGQLSIGKQTEQPKKAALVHPGVIIKRSIDEMSVSVADAAKSLCVTRQQLHRVIAGDCAVSPEMAVRLEKGIGIPASEWMRLQADYDIAQVRKYERSLKVVRIASAALGN